MVRWFFVQIIVIMWGWQEFAKNDEQLSERSLDKLSKSVCSSDGKVSSRLDKSLLNMLNRLTYGLNNWMLLRYTNQRI